MKCSSSVWLLLMWGLSYRKSVFATPAALDRSQLFNLRVRNVTRNPQNLLLAAVGPVMSVLPILFCCCGIFSVAVQEEGDTGTVSNTQRQRAFLCKQLSALKTQTRQAFTGWHTGTWLGWKRGRLGPRGQHSKDVPNSNVSRKSAVRRAHAALSQKAVIFILVAVRTWNLTGYPNLGYSRFPFVTSDNAGTEPQKHLDRFLPYPSECTTHKHSVIQ
jgi:hypothetical protein